MGVPTSEVGSTSAMPRREYHEVHKDMWGIGGEGVGEPRTAALYSLASVLIISM